MNSNTMKMMGMVFNTPFVNIHSSLQIVFTSKVNFSRTANLKMKQIECQPDLSLHQRLKTCDEALSKRSASLPKISEVSKTHNKVSSLSRPESKLCSILECEAHMALLKNLQMSSVTDIMVAFILSKNIMVNKIALDCNYAIVSTNNSRMIERNEFPNNLDPSIKILKFSASDDTIIEQNWNALIKGELNLVEEIAVKEIFETICEEKDIGLKRNIIGYFLSQGLQDIRLATDVYHRARIIKCFKRGDYTAEEDDIILKFVKSEGRKFAKLGKVLKRSRGSVTARYDLLVQIDNIKDGSPYTVDDAKVIITEVFANNKNILVDGKMKKEDWVKIGKKLQRSPRKVRQHWKDRLEPKLQRYLAGNLNTDMKEILINHMVEHNMMHAQDVDWKKLVNLSKFSGCTELFLQDLHANLKTRTRNVNKGMGAKDATSIEIQRYLQSSLRYTPSKKSKAYTKSIIEIYRSLK